MWLIDKQVSIMIGYEKQIEKKQILKEQRL